jgi:hypothetical protein
VRGPLLLFDPASPVILYSPGNESNQSQVRAEANHLMSILWGALPADEKPARFQIELAPEEMLPFVLDDPRLNLGDMAPGAHESPNALRMCADIRGGASFARATSLVDQR